MKKSYLNFFLFLLFLQNFSHAQPSVRQQRTIGSSSYDQSTCMALSKDGGYLLGGYNLGRGNFDQSKEGHGRDEYWIVKLDSLRNIEWDKTFGTDYVDKLYSMQSTIDSGYILAGTTGYSTSGDQTGPQIGGIDIWIIKLDSRGNIIWDRTIGGTDNELLPKIIQTKDGGYIFSCESYSNISGHKTENSRGYKDYWVVKLDALGYVQWDKTIGSKDFDSNPSIAEAVDGSYLVAGFSPGDSSGDKTEKYRGPSANNYDYWIAKLDKNGTLLWNKVIGGGRGDLCFSVDATYDNGFVLGGDSESRKSFEKSENSKGSSDYWIVKIDSLGKIQWDRTLGGSNIEYLKVVHQTRDGGYIVGGSSISGVGGDKSEPVRGLQNYPQNDYWIIKLNHAGELVWDKTIGGNSYDELTDIQQIEPHRYALVGTSKSGLSGDKNKPVKGGEINSDDYWYVEVKNFRAQESLTESLQATSTIFDNLNKKKQFQIYPNPARNVLYIQTSSPTSIILTNQNGQILLNKKIFGKSSIDISKFPSGNYYLKDVNTSLVEKIVILK